MRRLSVFIIAAVAFSFSALADEQTASVQRALKDQGFYYGEVDGNPGTETTAAIRRYQIRNGLEVNGQLTAETLAALRKSGSSAPPAVTSAPRTQTPQRAPAQTAPDREPDVAESDRQFLSRNGPPNRSQAPAEGEDDPEYETAWIGRDPAAPRPVEPARLSSVFARTPYERAPAVVQQDTMARVQEFLHAEGFYRGEIDASYGPETAAAVRSFQVEEDLPPTGALDLPTLAAMRLLPGRRGPFPAQRIAPRPQRRVYRGIWVR